MRPILRVILVVVLGACAPAANMVTEPSQTTPATTTSTTSSTSTTEAAGATTAPATTATAEVGDPETFCEAVALAPVRWIEDAVLPLQVWLGAFANLEDVPEEATDAVLGLREFAERRMSWHLGLADERPDWDVDQTEDALVLADSAIEQCPDLPLVIGLPGISGTPSSWSDLDAATIAENCADKAGLVQEGVAQFVAEYGRQPRHQMELEAGLPLFGASDYHGVTIVDGVAEVVPVPDGACDPAG